MASIGALIVDLIANTGGFETDLGRAARTAEKRAREIDQSIARMGSRIAGSLAAIGVGFSFSAIIEATSQAEAALAKLDNAVRNNAGAAGVTTKQLAEFSGELQRLTIYSDESIQEMQALLLTFKQIGGAQFKGAQIAVLNLATALGKDLNSAALLVGRALADPIKGMTALGRAGVVLSKDQQALIKSLSESGRLIEAQGILLSELESRFGGAASAARDNFAGALAGLKNAFGDLLELKGGLPALTSEINALSDALSSDAAKNTANTLGSGLITAIRGIGAAAAAVLEPISKFLIHANDLGALLDKNVFGEALSKSEFERLYGRSASMEGGHGALNRAPIVAPEEIQLFDEDDFINQAQKLSDDTRALMERNMESIANEVGEMLKDFELPWGKYFSYVDYGLRASADLQKELADGMTEFQGEMLDSTGDSLKQIVDAASESYEKMSEFAKSAARNIQSYMADFIFDPFEDGLSGMLTGFLNVIRRMLAEAAAAKLGEALFGKNGTSGALSGVFGAIFGGDSGVALATGTNYIPRDNFPAMLHKGEAVVPAQYNPAAGGAGGGITINMPIDARGSTQEAMALLPTVAKRASDDAVSRILEMRRRGKL